jgi:hypothetical protein
MFNSYFYKNKNEQNNICSSDIILNGLNFGNYNKICELRKLLGLFYENLFRYLCGFIRPEKGFDLICENRKIFIELKSNWKSDSHDSKREKFRRLMEFKNINPDYEVIYICLNDNRPNYLEGVDYIYNKTSFRIITGNKAWEYFCNIADVDKDELISLIRELVRNYVKI